MDANPFFRHQFPPKCPGRYTILRDDLLGAGLGWTAKLITFALIIAQKSGRILLEGESLQRWCTAHPGTLQCYYLPWTNCSLDDATDVQNLSLASFHRRGRWYGMSASTKDLQPAAFQLLYRPREQILSRVEHIIAQCGGSDYWTVHIRDSPEKRKERGRLPGFDEYTFRIPNGTKRILWQTSNPNIFEHMLLYSQRHSKIRYCYTSFPRHVRDVWGGRNKSLNDESGLIGVLNGEAGRRGIGCISMSSSMWTWFITIGTKQRLITV